MPGGVAGESGRPLPYADFASQFHSSPFGSAGAIRHDRPALGVLAGLKIGRYMVPISGRTKTKATISWEAMGLDS